MRMLSSLTSRSPARHMVAFRFRSILSRCMRRRALSHDCRDHHDTLKHVRAFGKKSEGRIKLLKEAAKINIIGYNPAEAVVTSILILFILMNRQRGPALGGRRGLGGETQATRR